MKKIGAIPRRANETANLKIVGLPVLIATVNHNRRQHTQKLRHGSCLNQSQSGYRRLLLD
jgi:hypothetical protein